ncbi:TIGR02611 family protein [Asanoa sp. WMMD1127]|uniref:TIGR02611 family protein n=1 Tax=Asanoa sp. WMMD1127 TaxID=3016107 RepID=UPI002415A7D8|nr:TIGR02611 family protein [Asanoa sp. WMMD1127]MDG4824066.1 TIGR02611 family protein [Asanoa sp. WMMD1127]
MEQMGSGPELAATTGEEHGVTLDRGSPPENSESGAVTDLSSTSRPHRGRVGETLELIRANPTGRMILRISVAIAGLAVVALGILLIPLPGPGWFIVIGGLAIWALEFTWAKKLLTFTRRNVRAWTSWIGRQPWPLRSVIGAVGLVFVAFIVWASVRVSFDIDLITETRNYFGW